MSGTPVVRFEAMPPDLAQIAARYAEPITDAVRKEYPNSPRHTMNGPDDVTTPSQLHPAFYGCFDWHSAVEMHWALVRLLRLAPEATPPSVAQVAGPAPHGREPEGGDGLLRRAPDLGTTVRLGLAAHPGRGVAGLVGRIRRRAGRTGGPRRSTPLANRLSDLMIDWLAKATYPTRDGAHMNSAFGLTRSWAWAERDGDLREAISHLRATLVRRRP